MLEQASGLWRNEFKQQVWPWNHMWWYQLFDKTLLRCPVWVLGGYPGEEISTITSRTPQSRIVSFPVILRFYESCVSLKKQKHFSHTHHWLWASVVSSNINPNWKCFFSSSVSNPKCHFWISGTLQLVHSDKQEKEI